MIELSRTQDEEVGDGTTSVIILGELFVPPCVSPSSSSLFPPSLPSFDSLGPWALPLPHTLRFMHIPSEALGA